MTAAHLRLVRVLVVVARWSTDLDVILTSGVLVFPTKIDGEKKRKKNLEPSLAAASPRNPTTARPPRPSPEGRKEGTRESTPAAKVIPARAARGGEGMLWEWEDGDEAARTGEEVPVDFDFFSFFAKPKDYYKILEVDYDASEETIRSSYIRLALKWHPDKKQDEEKATSRFQDINEAYQVPGGVLRYDCHKTKNNFGTVLLSNPVKRQEYDKKGVLYVQDQNAADYLNRHKGLILTCNGLGVRYSVAGGIDALCCTFAPETLFPSYEMKASVFMNALPFYS
ncbi:Chaperone protein DnaJ 1 [Triticum urartu]|uniref:Chaperone protein DnaJ 1 n=1 Tax=Triticum urartu TaxID=4572 RepID=M8ATJ8_TRIUA|nr:Chaperone protein DnaJ 1 [Triticum urartu]